MIRVQGSIPYPPTANAMPIRQFASSLRQLSAGLQQTSGQLTATAASAGNSWVGQASQAFGRHVQERSRVVQTVAQELSVVATTLDVYATAIDTTSATYSSAAMAEHAARAGMPWTSAALAAALMTQKAAYAAFLGAGGACKGQLVASNVRIASALFLGVDANSFGSVKDAVMEVWNGVSGMVPNGNATDAERRDAMAALDLAMWETVQSDAVRTAEDPTTGMGFDWFEHGLVDGAYGIPKPYEAFADQIRGGAHPMDATLAALTHDTYRVEGWDDGGQVGDWRRVTADQLPAGLTREHFENERWNSGLRAALYTDGSGRYVLSFAGWNDQWGRGAPSDFLNSVDQGLGGTPHQYNQALLLARRLYATYGDDLVISGHSLGGSLAAYASMGTGAPAVTYNAAGLHADNMRWASGLEPQQAAAAADTNIRNYRVGSDVLTNLQEGNNPLGRRMPGAVGQQIHLPDTAERPAFQWSSPWRSAMERLQHSGEMHRMGTVMEALDREQPWAAPGASADGAAAGAVGGTNSVPRHDRITVMPPAAGPGWPPGHGSPATPPFVPTPTPTAAPAPTPAMSGGGGGR